MRVSHSSLEIEIKEEGEEGKQKEDIQLPQR